MTPQDMVRLDFDVLACIAEFLPSHALVALMQTCRACYKAGLPLLCKLADTVPLTRIRQISSFTRFLRPEPSVHSQQDSSQSRARKIQRLHLDITYFGGLSPQYILTDLKQCVNLRQLYLQLTPQYDTGCSNFCAIGRTMFYQAVSQWRSLEELELVLLPHEGVVEGLKCLNNLHQLSTLRFLFPSPCCARPRRLPPVLSVISTLPLSQRLRELDLCSEQDSQDVPDVCLPNVQTLGFCFDPNSTDITSLTRAFPGVVHLRLHTAQPAPSCIDLEPDFTRRNFMNEWPTPPVDVWPSLQSVWVQSLNTLYAFAMPLQVRQISYQCINRLFERYSFDEHMTTVLDAAQPEMVEVRVAIDSKLERAAFTPQPHGRDNVDSKNLLRGLYRNASMRSLVVTFLNVATAEDLDDIVHRIQVCVLLTPIMFISSNG